MKLPSVSEPGWGNGLCKAAFTRQIRYNVRSSLGGYMPAALGAVRSGVSTGGGTSHPPKQLLVITRAHPEETSTPEAHHESLPQHLCKATFAFLTSAALIFGPCDHAEAAHTGARFSGRHTTSLTRKLRPVSTSFLDAHRSPHRLPPGAARHRAPMSVRLHAMHSPPMALLPLSSPAPDIGAAHVHLPRPPPLLLGDMLAYPDLAAGVDLEALPLWASLLGLLAANAAGLAVTLAVVRGLQDTAEPVSVVKLQVAMLERRPQLQSKLRELNSMIQVGQQGAWLILEEAILELIQHQGTIAYAAVSCEQLSSKKRAYTVFGEIAEAEAAKARSEEAVVRHMGETSDEEEAVPGRPAGGGGGLLSGIMGGLGLGGGPGKPVKELTVITLVLAARGKLDIPSQVSDWRSLRHALQQVTGLSSDRIMAVELLWTPREESDYLTRAQLEKDYPQLVPFGGQQQQTEAAGKK